MLASLEAKLIATVVLMAFVVGLGWYLHHSGYEQGKAEVQIDVEKANQKAEADLAAKDKVIQEKQSKLDESFTTISNKEQEIQSANQNYQTLVGQYRDGIKRLSVRTSGKRNSASKGKVAIDSTGTDKVGSVAIMPSVSVGILDAARGLKESVRLKNECIDLLNAERSAQ